MPVKILLYGDVNGNIGYIARQKPPFVQQTVRLFTYDGTTDANDWKGFVPYEECPNYSIRSKTILPLPTTKR